MQISTFRELKNIQLEYLLTARFTARDKSIIADLLLAAYKDGFINGCKTCKKD